MSDKAIPQLPAISMERTIDFYKRLGFSVKPVSPGGDYAIADRGTLEIHFFLHQALVPTESAFGCYFRVADADSLYSEFHLLGLPSKGIPRITAIEDKPWGMHEFAIIDENGSLIRIGHEI